MADRRKSAATSQGRTALRLQRLGVALLFYVLALSALYVHVVAWPLRYQVGQVLPYTVYSPITFSYIDTQKERALTGNAADGAERWIADPTVRQSSLQTFDSFRGELGKLRRTALRLPEQAARSQEVDDAIHALAKQHDLDPHFVELLSDFSDERFEEVLTRARQQLDQAMSEDVAPAKIETLKQQGTDALVKAPENLYIYFLRPNLHPALAQTPAADIKALATVTVQKGSVVAAEGQRVDERTFEQLGALQQYLGEQSFLRWCGIGVVLLIALFICGRYLSAFAPRLYQSPVELMQLGGLFMLMLVVGLTVGRLPLAYSFYGVSLAVAMLAAIVVFVFDPLFALYFSLGLAICLSLGLNFGADLFLYTLSSALLPPVLVSARAQRRALVSLAFGMGLLNMLMAVTVILVSVHTWHAAVLPVAFCAGFFAVILAIGLLPLVETLSGQITPARLIELASPENALLRKLKEEAHGTWMHSQMVAELTEEACKDIRANWLVAKVGALYHDIGKLKRPGFFAENIHDLKRNPHQGLPPETSARIVRDHVADGLVLARENKLPRDLHQFIAEHHGTYLIRYFYAAAERLHEADPEHVPAPEREQFRYAGPIPQTRESGVVMLADITEAVMRTKPDVDGAEIRRIIDAIISDKIAEGQLTSSGLTLGDLEMTKEAFVRTFSGQRHQRVVYPGQTADVPQMHFHSRNPGS
jgi:putative nucleotidyltransferase with HDIG domain